MGSHLSKTLENLQRLKDHALGSQLDAKILTLREDILCEVAQGKTPEAQQVTGDQLARLAESVDQKLQEMEGRVGMRMRGAEEMAAQRDKILENELDTRFSEHMKQVMRLPGTNHRHQCSSPARSHSLTHFSRPKNILSSLPLPLPPLVVKNEHLLSMRQTIDLDIRNAEQRMADKFQSAVDETRAQADRSAQAFDEKFSEIKSEVAGSKAAAQDEYLEILHTMSERIKDLDSRYQEVLLTSENGLEWVQEKQGNLVTQLREDLEAKMEAIAAKAEALAIQSEESVTKSQLAEALAPLEAKATALEADISGKVDAIRTTTEDLGRDLAEIANRSKTEIANQAEELSKIQNAQRDLYCGLYCTSKVLKEKILSVETKLESIAADKPSMEAPLGPGETKVVTRLGDEVEAQGARIAGVEREAAISQKHVEHLSATIESRAEEARIHLAQSLAQVREVSLISLAEIPPSLPPVGGFPLGFPARVSRSAYISRSGLRVSSFPMEPLRGTPFGGREGTTQWETLAGTLAGKGTKIVFRPRAVFPLTSFQLVWCVTLPRRSSSRTGRSRRPSLGAWTRWPSRGKASTEKSRKSWIRCASTLTSASPTTGGTWTRR